MITGHSYGIIKCRADVWEIKRDRALPSVMYQLQKAGPRPPASSALSVASRAEAARGLRHMFLEGLRRLRSEGRVGAAPCRELLEPPPRPQPHERGAHLVKVRVRVRVRVKVRVRVRVRVRVGVRVRARVRARVRLSEARTSRVPSSASSSSAAEAQTW